MVSCLQRAAGEEICAISPQAKAEKHSANLSALMVTYPSTYGVFEEGIIDITDTIHKHGGQVRRVASKPRDMSKQMWTAATPPSTTTAR